MLSLNMLDRLIELCPDRLWAEKHGGFVFWQQLLHAYTGALFWTRGPGVEFAEPYAERNLYPEFEHDPEGTISRDELSVLARRVRDQIETSIQGKTDAWLAEPSPVYDKITNADVLIGQVRHIQYHVGHCDSILREHGEQTPEWVDYLGE